MLKEEEFLECCYISPSADTHTLTYHAYPHICLKTDRHTHTNTRDGSLLSWPGLSLSALRPLTGFVIHDSRSMDYINAWQLVKQAVFNRKAHTFAKASEEPVKFCLFFNPLEKEECVFLPVRFVSRSSEFFFFIIIFTFRHFTFWSKMHHIFSHMADLNVCLPCTALERQTETGREKRAE